jgi:molybdate transport system substrate-binding protein
LTSLSLLSAGAAQSVTSALAARHGISVNGEFGAVGAMQRRLRDGAPCDLIILTQAMVADLAREGRVIASADLGSVPTCIAAREEDAVSDLSTEGLKRMLGEAHGIYFPDPEKATAGMHFKKVLEALGVTANWRTWPNGATAMREMARAQGKVIGCTQATEILATSGLRLVGPLPGEFALSTPYSVGVCAAAAQPGVAHRFLALLAGEESRALRIEKGFQP